MFRRRRSYVTEHYEIKEILSSECGTMHYNRYFSPIKTLDKTLVRKILVANVASSTTQEDLKKIFKEYGNIIDCNLKRKSLLKKSYAFITFESSYAAHSALYHGYHKEIKIDGQYLRVLPAAAWHQPDRNKFTNNKPIKLVDIEDNRLSVYNHYSSNDESPISKLNEYCLLHIFGFLPIRDTIRIERVCRYWQIIITSSLQWHNKKFDSILSNDNWKHIKNAPTLYKILEKFGSYITRLNDLDKKGFIGNSTLIAIARLCPNIEEINLSNFPFLASGIKALAKNCSKIKGITIGKSSHESYKSIKYDKELSALFSKNRNLQYLHFNGDTISGSCLKHVSTKYITCISLTGQNCLLFIHIISKIKNLFTLDVHSCSNVDVLLEAKGLKMNTENIEKLTITTDGHRNIRNLNIIRAIQECTINNFFKFSNLKNLKYLNLRHYPLGYVTNEFLLTLAENFNHQLTHLDISGAKGLTNSGLICIITSLSKLEHFHMAEMYETVTDEIFCCGMPNLKTLNCSNCLGIRDEGLVKFINNSDKLEKLDVRLCQSITNKLILAAIECTKRRENEIVLSIDASLTKINLDISDLKENSSLLEFKCSSYKTPYFVKKWLCNNEQLRCYM